MSTLTYLTGAEHGLSSLSVNGAGLCDEIIGSPSIQSSIKKSGSYAFRFQLASAGSCNFQKKLANTSNYEITSFQLYIATEPSTRCKIWVGGNSGGTYGYAFYDPSDHKMEFVIGTGTGNKANVVLSTGQWYRIDIKYDMSTTTHKIDGKVDGTAATQYTNAIGSIWTAFSVRYGLGSGESVTGDIYIDDIAVSETPGDYPLGAIQVLGLRPNADGTHNNAANVLEDYSGADIDGSTVFAYAQLNDDPWTSAINANLIRCNTAGSANYVESQFADISQTTVLGAMAILEYASASSTTNNGACIVRDSDAQETTVWGNPTTRADYSESSAFYKSAIIATPSGGWTKDYVNSLRMRNGYSSDATPDPFWVAFIIEVAVAAGSVTPQSLTAGLSFTASSAKLPQKAITAGLSFVGGFIKLGYKSFTAGISFVGSSIKLSYKSLVAGLSFNAILAGSKVVLKSLTSTLSFSGNFIKQKFQSIISTLSFSAGLTRKDIYKLLAGQLSYSAILAATKVALKSLTAGLSFTAPLVSRANKVLVGSLSFTAGIGKQINKGIIAVLSFAGSIASAFMKFLTAALSFTASLDAVKIKAKLLEAAMGFSAILTKYSARAFSGSFGFGGVLERSLAKSFTAALSFSAGIKRDTGKGIIAALSFSGSLIKRISKALEAALSFIGTLIKIKPSAARIVKIEFAFSSREMSESLVHREGSYNFIERTALFEMEKMV